MVKYILDCWSCVRSDGYCDNSIYVVFIYGICCNYDIGQYFFRYIWVYVLLGFDFKFDYYDLFSYVYWVFC